MPREMIHCFVLERAESWAASVRACLDANRGAAMLGAVLHDAPYYYRLGASPFEHVAEWLHGRHGEDTFTPLLRLAEEIQRRALPDEARAALWAVLLGMVSHLVADTIFHPMVFYFTGDYYDPDPLRRRDARARHRALEVYLDTWCVDRKRFSPVSIRSCFDSLGPNRPVLLELLNAMLARAPWDDVELPAWSGAIRFQAGLQTAFLSPVLGRAAAMLRRAAGPALAPHEALFAVNRRPHSLFDSPLEFRNPVTGAARRASVDDLLSEAAGQCSELFDRFEPLLAGTAEPAASVLEGVTGASLSFGVPGAKPEDAHTYSPTGLPLPGLML